MVPVPTFVNGMARGALPLEHRCNFRLGRTPVLQKTDCVILCGTPMDFRLGYGEKISAEARIIQVDLDAAQIGHNRGVDVGIVGDIGIVLSQLAGRLTADAKSWPVWSYEVEEIEKEKQQSIDRETGSSDQPISPLRLCAEVDRFVDEKTIVIGDGGDFVATAAYTLHVQGPGSWMDPGPLGTLGVGPGFAIAAKLARPDHRVILMLGDGSFGFNGMEFETMVRHNLPVVGIIGNDARWTQIYRGQVALYGKDRAVATTLRHTRYDIIIQAFGGHGEFVERLDDLGPALERAFRAGVPALVNVKIGDSGFRKDAFSV